MLFGFVVLCSSGELSFTLVSWILLSFCWLYYLVGLLVSRFARILGCGFGCCGLIDLFVVSCFDVTAVLLMLFRIDA